MVDDDEPVADGLELGEDMRAHENGSLPGAHRADKVAHLGDPDRIEAVGRFVENQQLGVAEERGGDTKALFHPERVAAVAVTSPISEPDGGEHLGDAPLVETPEASDGSQVLGPG